MTYHREDFHAGQDSVQTDVLVAMVDELIGDEDVGQAGQTGEIGRIGLDGRILELLDHIAQALDQIVLSLGWRREEMFVRYGGEAER